MIIKTFFRIFVEREAIDTTVAFYESLLGSKVDMRFDYPETGLELASVSSAQLSVLIIAGSKESRAPFETTRLTVKVERLEEIIPRLRQGGAEQLELVQKTPVGRKTRFKHPDGTTVEYVDHDVAANT